MQYEHVFSVSSARARRLDQVDLASSGFLERQHLQEWLLANPQILGPDVIVVTSEFDRWQNAMGDARRDRLDILGIDSGGQLVVAELKRDAASSDVDLQALKYAALVSRFSDDTLVEAHQRYLASRGGSDSLDEARASLEHHIDGPLDPETWTQPKIVLVANAYPDTVTNTVAWLSEAGLEIVLLRYQMYRTEGDPLLVVSQIYPVPDADEFLLAPRREEVQQAKQKTRSRQKQADAVKVLIAEGAIEAGAHLHLEPTGINDDLREAVNSWLSEDPSRSEGEWTGDPSAPILWQYTNERGKPSAFATHVLEEAAGVRRALQGTKWWLLDDGTSLSDLALQYLDAQRGRDWSDLHGLLEALPTDRWTTYGDVARVIGTAAQPLGQHLTRCEDCVNAAQVLTTNGAVAENFQWSDPAETRSAREVLENQGIRFTGTGLADPSQRLGPEQLASLLVD